MTELAFVLGSNWLLSIAELVVYLEDRGLANAIKDHTRKAIIIDPGYNLEDRQLLQIQSALGGCFKVGRVVAKVDRSIVDKAYPAKGKAHAQARRELHNVSWVSQIWPNPKDEKIEFGISTYPMLHSQRRVNLRLFTRGLDESVKTKLKKQGARRASFIAYHEPDRRNPKKPNVALWPQTIARHGLLKPPNAEVLAILASRNLYIAKTAIVYDSLLQQYRDESRPFVSAEISTSPKVCRTLLNLAGARAGDIVLDPFCGTGTLLMEAAILGMRCIGIDKDPDMVQGARSNLKWLSIDLGMRINYRIVRGDARNTFELVNKKVDSVAFEPYFGPVHDDKPSAIIAEKIVEELTELYNQSLTNIELCLRSGGRVGMSVPVINAKKGPKRIDFKSMLEGTGLEIRNLLPMHFLSTSDVDHKDLRIRPERESLPERKRGQVVQRDIVMLEKP